MSKVMQLEKRQSQDLNWSSDTRTVNYGACFAGYRAKRQTSRSRREGPLLTLGYRIGSRTRQGWGQNVWTSGDQEVGHPLQA